MFVQLNDETITELPLYYKNEQTEKKGFWGLLKDIFLITSGVRFHG
jgi:hypothetical protein